MSFANKVPRPLRLLDVDSRTVMSSFCEDQVLNIPPAYLRPGFAFGGPEPTGYWLSDLPADTPIAELVRLAKIRWRVEHDYRELKTGLGLDHFEGRSFTGWHRHVTLVVLAQAFITMLRTDPKDSDGSCGPLPGDENGGAHVARRRRLDLALRDRPKD